jgi:hypothetical protein
LNVARDVPVYSQAGLQSRFPEVTRSLYAVSARETDRGYFRKGEFLVAEIRAGETAGETVVKDLGRTTRRQFSAEEKIRIVLEGLQGEESIAELCLASRRT